MFKQPMEGMNIFQENKCKELNEIRMSIQVIKIELKRERELLKKKQTEIMLEMKTQ